MIVAKPTFWRWDESDGGFAFVFPTMPSSTLAWYGQGRLREQTPHRSVEVRGTQRSTLRLQNPRSWHWNNQYPSPDTKSKHPDHIRQPIATCLSSSPWAAAENGGLSSR